MVAHLPKRNLAHGLQNPLIHMYRQASLQRVHLCRTKHVTTPAECTQTHAHARTRACAHARTHARDHACAHAHAHTRTRTRDKPTARTRARTRTHTNTRTHHIAVWVRSCHSQCIGDDLGVLLQQNITLLDAVCVCVSLRMSCIRTCTCTYMYCYTNTHVYVYCPPPSLSRFFRRTLPQKGRTGRPGPPLDGLQKEVAYSLSKRPL